MWMDWSRLFASMPAIFMGILLTHAVHLRLALGHWPYGYRDYPSLRVSRILLDIHELGLVVPGFFLSLLAAPLWLVTAILSRPTWREVGGQLLVFLLGIAALYCGVWALSLTFYTQWLGD